MEIIPMDSQTWRLEDGFVRCFLLTGTERALLVDSGVTPGEAKAAAESLTALPITLLNTHADRDHVADNDAFPTALMHPAECANYGRGPIAPVWDGDVIDLGGRPLQVIAIPGHTPGSIALLDESRRVLYPGDTVQDGDVFLFGPFRDTAAYRYSLQRLLRYKDRFDAIHPSHGSIPLRPEALDALCEGVEQLFRGELASARGAFQDMPLTIYHTGPATLLCDVLFSPDTFC